MTLRLLVAEDEPDVATMIAFSARLTWPGCRVSVATGGEEALRRFDDEGADLVVLDVAMPPPDGFEVCRRLRAVSRVPILMLTVRGATEDKVRALDLGADDYLTKPFDPLELMARLRALLRRVVPHEDPPDETITFSDLSMDVATREVRRGERRIELTRTEFTLLEMFLRRPRRVLERSFILEEVWGYDFPTTANSLEVYVGYLRRKTEAEGEPRLIHTVRGVGYVLKEA